MLLEVSLLLSHRGTFELGYPPHDHPSRLPGRVGVNTIDYTRELQIPHRRDIGRLRIYRFWSLSGVCPEFNIQGCAEERRYMENTDLENCVEDGP